MSLSFLQKQIIKLRPNAIKRMKRIDDADVAYAIECGLVPDEKKLDPYFLEFPSYISKCLEFGTEEVYEFLTKSENIIYMPPKVKDRFIQMLLESDYVLPNSSNIAYEIQCNPDLWLKTIKADSSRISEVVPISYLNISDIKRGEFFSELSKLDISYENLSSLDQSQSDLIQLFMPREPENVIKRVCSWINSKETKEALFANLERNVAYIDIFKRYRKSLEFTEEEKSRIVESAIKSNYHLKAGDYDFLMENAELMYSTIMSMDTTFDEGMCKNRQILSALKNMTPEQQRAVGKKIATLKCNFNDYSFCQTLSTIPEIIDGMIEENPYSINSLIDVNWQEEKRIVGKLRESEYVAGRTTPRYILFGDIEVFLQGLEKNFTEFIQNPSMRGTYDDIDIETDRRIYEICKENGYVIDDSSCEMLKQNPFLLRDALKLGRISNIKEAVRNVRNEKAVNESLVRDPAIRKAVYSQGYSTQTRDLKNARSALLENILLPSSNSLLQENPEVVMASIRSYFPSIMNANKALRASDFSREEQEEISRLYFEYMDSHPRERADRVGEFHRILKQNPFILMEQLERGEEEVFEEAGEILSEEDKRTIAIKYLSRNGSNIDESTISIYTGNPYIAEAIIRDNPQAYDFIKCDSPRGREYDIAQIKDAWKSGKYRITDSIHYRLLNDEEIFEYCMQNEVEILARRCSSIGNKNLIKRIGEIREKYLEGVKNRTIIPDSKAFYNLFGNYAIPDEQKFAIMLDFVKINPQYMDVYPVYDFGDDLPQELREIMKEAIQSGKYVASEKTPGIIREDEELKKYIVIPETEGIQRRTYRRTEESEIERTFRRYRGNSEEAIQVLLDKGIDVALNENSIEMFRLNQDIIMYSLTKDFSLIKYVSPMALFDEEKLQQIVEIALKNNYEITQSTPIALRNSKELAINALRTNPEQLVYFGRSIPFSEEEKEQILNGLLSSDKKIILGEYSFDFLRNNPDYIRFSIENSTPENIKSVIDNIDIEEVDETYRKELIDIIRDKIASGEYVFDEISDTSLLKFEPTLIAILEKDISNLVSIGNFLEEMPLESQKKINEFYQAQSENERIPDNIEELMHKNTYYMQGYILENIDRIDEIECNGIFLEPEFKKELAKRLIQAGYEITENSPRFILNNQEFLVEYIAQNPEKVSTMDKQRVSILFTPERIKENPELLKVFDVISDTIKTPVSEYVNSYGKEKAMLLLTNFGSAIQFLNRDIDYSLDEAREELFGIFKRGGITNAKDAIHLISNLNIHLTAEDFQGLGNLVYDSELFERILQQDPEYIKYYSGFEERIFEQAIELGAFSDKTPEQISDLLSNSARQQTIVINYLLDNDSKKWIEVYTGKDEKVFGKAVEVGSFDDLKDEEIEELLRAQNFRSSSELMSYLIEHRSPGYIKNYSGSNIEILERAIEVGAMETLSDEDLEMLFERSGIAKSNKTLMLHLLEKRSPELIERYTGQDEEVYKKALECGYKVNIEKLKTNMSLLASEVILEAAAEINPNCYGLRFYNAPKEEIENRLEKLYGDTGFLTPEKKSVFTGLCSVLTDPESGERLLGAFTPELVDKIGLDNWRTLIRYSIKHPSLTDISNIATNQKLDDFLKLYKTISPMITDDVALGINKFLNIATFYQTQPQLCSELIQNAEEGKEISDKAKLNLQTLIYNTGNYEEEQIDLARLENLVESDKTRYLEGLDSKSAQSIKSDLLKYLFNMNYSGAESLLTRDINSKVVAEIMSSAKKSKNQVLELEAGFMSVLVDTLEQVYYARDDEEALREFAKRIYSADEKDILKIRKQFVNIRETVRRFYERDAQEELTDIRGLMSDPTHVKEFDYQFRDEPAGKIKVVDISDSKHTVYCHVLGTEVDAMFDTDAGRPTICVSPETDMHEAFYGGETGVILVFSEIPKGSFIGSAPANMGSNSVIGNNDYRVDAIASSLRQMGIRQSHSEDGHAETLLYRAGLYPTGIKMVGEVPSEKEIKAAKEFERKIFETTGQRVEIPIVKTQHQRNRVVRYPQNVTGEKTVEEFLEESKKIQDMRKQFFGIVDTGEKGQAIRTDYDSKEYTIINGEVYYVSDLSSNPTANATEKVAMQLEELVHGSDSEFSMDYRELQAEDGKQYIASRRVEARDLWHYNRTNGSFSHKTNAIMLKEFLVDHLLCNYSANNKSFALAEDETIYPLSKRNSFRAREDFVTREGELYTSMSYLYFDDESGNNLYRRVFEDYIHNPDENQILTNEELEDFVETAKQISAMDDTEYLEMFKPVLDSMDEESTEEVRNLIMTRKKNAGRDAVEFVGRLRELRAIEQEPDIIENPEGIAFANDVHGNLAALDSIIKDCRENGKKTLYVLGDMIGFGPQSNECIDLLREASKDVEIKCILGNHEMYSLMGNRNFGGSMGFEPDFTNKTRRGLSPENRAFLEGLPISRRLVVDGKNVELTHFPVRSNYIEDQQIYLAHGSALTESRNPEGIDYLIYGHEHRTELTTGDEVGECLTTDVAFGDKKTTYINLPSSGCVHGKRTSYVTLGLEAGKLKAEVVPIEYDQQKTKDAIRREKITKPHFFGYGGMDEQEL